MHSAKAPPKAPPKVAVRKVKQEPEEPEPPSDPVEVPPGVVLDKLEALLNSGRILLRYASPSSKARWGTNGKVANAWCSFRVEADGSCQFVDDDTLWSTEAAAEWADSELEWLLALP
mmetsp:Transcript_71476/g.158063  ORF Transcript_71476/g.158063 Transcript_71476/m.158063 type:complete len:117 (-) Transcript_71476:12-362(-)